MLLPCENYSTAERESDLLNYSFQKPLEREKNKTEQKFQL